MDADGTDQLDEKYMKNKVIKREAAAAVDHHDMELMDDDLLLSGTTDEEYKKKLLMTATTPKKGSGSGAGGSSMKCCQAEKCSADLSDAKQYYRRHKVCELHAKAHMVIVAGIRQRFCQQCSRFHELSEFDEAKRSCRRRLAGHNERRRKNTSADQSHAESSSGGKGTATTQMKEIVCGQVDDRAGRIQITIQENAANYKHFQIRS